MLTEATPDEWVRYHPPKSVSFGHAARVRDPRKAWSLVEHFLEAQSNVRLGHHIRLSCREATREAARAAFGPADEGGGWDIAPDQVEIAAKFALDDDKLPKQEFGPTTFFLHYWFEWKSVAVPPVEERRPLDSGLGIKLGGHSVFLQPGFTFPYRYDAPELRELLVRIEPLTPFRFRDQYFQRWLPPKGKTSFGKTLKLPKNWRGAWQTH